MIGTLAVDGWAVTFITTWRGLGGLRPRPVGPLFAVPNITGHPSSASIATSYYSMCHYNCLCILKGDLETGGRGLSRSLKMAPFDRSYDVLLVPL